MVWHRLKPTTIMLMRRVMIMIFFLKWSQNPGSLFPRNCRLGGIGTKTWGCRLQAMHFASSNTPTKRPQTPILPKQKNLPNQFWPSSPQHQKRHKTTQHTRRIHVYVDFLQHPIDEDITFKTQTTTWLSGNFFAGRRLQLLVNCWFGLVVWIPRIPPINH